MSRVSPRRNILSLRILAWYLAIGFLLFSVFYSPNILNPFFVGWLYERSDAAAQQLGFSYFVSSEWSFPLGLNPRFGMENSLSIFYTDSIPLLAFIAKLAIGGGSEYQLYGIAMLFNCIAAFIIAAKIFGFYTKSISQKSFAAFLVCLIPIGAYRLMPELGHIALSLQSVVFLNILVFGYKYRLSAVSSSLLVLLSVSIHPYFGLMSISLALGGLVDNFIIREKNYIAFLKGIVFSSFMFMAYLYCVGFFAHKIKSGEPWGYGFFSASLVDFIDPTGYDLEDKEYLGMSFSNFWGGLDIDHDVSWEGFAYLGSGVLVLIGLGLILWAWRLAAKPKSCAKSLTRNAGFACVVAVLYIISLSHEVRLGGGEVYRLAERVYISQDIIGLLHNIRSSARFAWPLYYTVCFLSIGEFLRFTHKYRSFNIWVIATLSSIVVIQYCDISSAAGSMRQSFPVNESKILLIEDRLKDLFEYGGKKALVYDGPNVSSVASLPLGRLAMRAGMSTNIFFGARERASITPQNNFYNESTVLVYLERNNFDTSDACNYYFGADECNAFRHGRYKFLWLQSDPT